MKKLIVSVFAFSLFTLAGCGQKPVVEESENTQPNSEIDQPVEAEKTELVVPEAGVTLLLPDAYSATKNTELNRRGSFASYDFKTANNLSPVLQEVQFFSETSIGDFTEKCQDAQYPCFFGSYPNLETYEEEKLALLGKSNSPDKEYKLFGGRDFLVSNFICQGDKCVIREYTTFVGDTKIDFWVSMSDADTSTEFNQVRQADELFAQLEIKTEGLAKKSQSEDGRFTNYEGAITVSGDYKLYVSDSLLGETLCFNVDQTTAHLIPRGEGDERAPWFCFSNQNEALGLFELDLPALSQKGTTCVQGAASIQVSEYVVDTLAAETYDQARLDKIISKEPFVECK